MTPEQEEIVRSLRRLVPDRAAARGCAEGGEPVDRALWRKLGELGLTAVSAPEQLGGSGGSLEDETVVAASLAEMVAPVPVVTGFVAAHVLAAGEGPAASPLMGELAAGQRLILACLSASRGLPEGLVVQSPDGQARLTGMVADLLDGGVADVLLVPVDGRWWAVDATGPGVERVALRSIDFTRPIAAITFRDAPAQAVSGLPPQGVLPLAWTLLAAEASGVASAALGLSTDYARERKQFGQPIGRFQAIKHKLSDGLIAVEGARSGVVAAVASQQNGLPDVRSARLAKSVASAAGTAVACEAVQIHGAIGNTWEHDLHLLLRRAKFCQLALGSSDAHLDALAADLMERPPEKGRGRVSADAGLRLEPADRQFLQALQAWLDENATPERLREVQTGGVPARRAWQAQMAEAGWVGIHWPKAHNGRGATFVQQVLYHSELAARGLPPLVGNRGLSQVGPTLIAHGSDDQRTRFLEATRRADILWATGFSEPGSGSDLASLRTRGVVDGDEIVISGQKTWTTSAHFSDYLYTLVRTGPLTPKHAGISCVLVPLGSPGVTIRPIRRMSGPAEFNDVFLDDVRVPMANVVGQIDQGWQVTRTTLSHEHMTNFLGSQLRQTYFVESLVRKLAEREGQTGLRDVSLRRRAAQAWTNTQLLRLHGLRNITKVVEGQDPGAEGSIMKLFGQEEERRIYELALDLQGAAGLYDERASRNFLGARAATVGGGTSEVHRNKIAERVLGMPRDPWSDQES
ncbi:acyl-CoA dehydrogenase [Phenylobacterium sp.]|uniref:acyl-CoA dehydrogenase n=1 Tax=Phenylobacterium sp. TaxID=1871053 RepID=UPI00301E42B1